MGVEKLIIGEGGCFVFCYLIGVCFCFNKFVVVVSWLYNSLEIVVFFEKEGVCDYCFVGFLLKFCLIVEGEVDIYLCFG